MSWRMLAAGVGIVVGVCVFGPWPTPPPRIAHAIEGVTPENTLKPRVPEDRSVAERPASLLLDRPTGPLASLPRLLRVTSRIYTGGEPRGPAAFSRLSTLGVKTVVSVDAAPVDIAAAKAAKLRYIHIPIGYREISPQAAGALAQLVRTAEGPFYIHCHHGRHRGPAAAAVACIADGAVDAKQALAVLRAAGTSKKYLGLWRDVAGYKPPPVEAKLPALTSAARITSLQGAMAMADRRFDRLKLCQALGWRAPADHPDISPRREALLLKQALADSLRTLPEELDEYDAAFRAALRGSVRDAAMLQASLKDNRLADAERNFARVSEACDRCHAQHRN